MVAFCCISRCPGGFLRSRLGSGIGGQISGDGDLIEAGVADPCNMDLPFPLGTPPGRVYRREGWSRQPALRGNDDDDDDNVSTFFVEFCHFVYVCRVLRYRKMQQNLKNAKDCKHTKMPKVQQIIKNANKQKYKTMPTMQESAKNANQNI